MRKRSSGIPTRSGTNQSVQLQKMDRSLKFWILEEEELYYPCSENKGADQLCRVTAQLICAFVFAQAKIWFSHDSAEVELFQPSV